MREARLAYVESRASELLQLYGLSPREASVYLLALRTGAIGAGEIAKALSLRRMEAYRLVKKLSDANLIQANAGKPVTYSALPVDSVISAMMEGQTQKTRAMESAMEELLALSKALPRGKTRPSEQQFKIIQGREQIYNKIARLAEGASMSLDLLLTRNDLVQAFQLGITERLTEAASRGVKVRVLSSIDDSSLEAAEALQKKCDLRHSTEAVSGRMVLADRTASVSSLVLDDSQGRRNERDIAVSSESPNYAEMMSSLFDVAYKSAAASGERIGAVRESRALGGRIKSLADVLQATLPEGGWEAEMPGILLGKSGASYSFAVVARKGKRAVGLDVVAAKKEQETKDNTIQSIMKKLDLPDEHIIVVSTDKVGEDVERLAKLMGVGMISARDTIGAVSEVKKALKGWS
ncbi:MAG: hypothetical protein LYZ70_07510 [Nitrososphaerales archaeon]|nr:hypothetical protein [Nitrososphaerales archaeon]